MILIIRITTYSLQNVAITPSLLLSRRTTEVSSSILFKFDIYKTLVFIWNNLDLSHSRLLSTNTKVLLNNAFKSSYKAGIKRHISDIKSSSENCTKSIFLLKCSPWKICTGISLGVGVKYFLNNGPAFCKALPPSRLIQRRPNIGEDSSKFDWTRFFQYLWPHRWLLGAAVAVSINVSHLISISCLLGRCLFILYG